MDYNLFLSPFFVSFSAAAIVLWLLIFWNRRKNRIDDMRTSGRHIHQSGISRFGGVALILSFILTIFLDKNLVMTMPLAGVLIASGSILIFGIIDDIKQLSWKTQLFFQFFLVSFIYLFGIHLQYITNPFGGIFLLHNFWGYIIGLAIATVWVTLMINSMNWIDGVDGVSSGITIISAITIFILSLRPEVNQPPIGIIAVVFLGGVLAFFILNFNPAKILAGTSGSMFMGFILAVLAIFSGAKIATTLLVMTIPVVDALWVIGERIKSRKSIFSADRRHLHYKLLEIGWSQKKICFFYCLITLFIAIIALNTRATGKIVTFFLTGIFMAVMLFVIGKKIKDNDKFSIIKDKSISND